MWFPIFWEGSRTQVREPPASDRWPAGLCGQEGPTGEVASGFILLAGGRNACCSNCLTFPHWVCLHFECTCGSEHGKSALEEGWRADGPQGGKACCWWLRVSKRWMSPAGSWNQEALSGIFPSSPCDPMVQDAKIDRPDSSCFPELHKLFGLTWAGQNKNWSNCQNPMNNYSPACASGCFD